MLSYYKALIAATSLSKVIADSILLKLWQDIRIRNNKKYSFFQMQYSTFLNTAVLFQYRYSVQD